MTINKLEAETFIKELKDILKETKDTHRKIVLERLIFKLEQLLNIIETGGMGGE